MDALTGKLLAERYQLFERLDDTATALTYRGQDRQLGSACRVVVPKLSARASFGSFERTWRQLAELRSPHLAPMTAQARLSGGRPFVVFRWIEGRTLDQIIRAEGAISSARALTICRAVLLALKVAHDRAIVHRDVTPRNVVIGHGPDAGTIKLVGFAGAPRDAIDARAVPGDPTALAPERFADPRVATPRSDLYAVGVLLYTMLAGRPPFEPDDPTDTEAAFGRLSWLHTHAQPARPNTGVPEGTWRLTLSLLEKRSEDRPAHADAALSALSAGDHTSIPPPFVPDMGATRDPFESLVKARGPLDALSTVGSADGIDPFDLAEEATVADAGYLGEDEDEEPTVQQAAPALSVAAQMLFGKRRIDPFARTIAGQPVIGRASTDQSAADQSAGDSAGAGPVHAGAVGADEARENDDPGLGDGESSMDRLSALMDADPLAIEAEHDSLSDVVDELTLPGQVSHLRAMVRPTHSPETDPPTTPQRPGASVPESAPVAQPRKPFKAEPLDDLLTRPLHSGAAIPEAPLDDLLLRPRPPASPPGVPPSDSQVGRLVGRSIGSGIKTRAARPSGKLDRSPPTPRPSDALARLPDVSAFAEPGLDEVSTIAAPDRPRTDARQLPALDPKTLQPRAAETPTNQQPTVTAARPLNLPDDRSTQRIVGTAIAVAALLAIISGLMWFTSGETPTEASPASDAPATQAPASQPPIRTPIGE